MKETFFILLLFFHLLCPCSFAEDIPCSVPTPNACGLQMFGVMPVSSYSGTVDVSVPLHSSFHRGVSLNVSLLYDTSGLLMNCLPGCVGYGWTLNAGGSVTRLRVFDDDELYWPHQGRWDNDSEYAGWHCRNNKECGEQNSSPDVFVFNFLGNSGRFFLGNDGEWKVMCDRNIDVQLDINDASSLSESFVGGKLKLTGIHHPKVIRGFTLVDDSGNEYVFGMNDDAIEYSVDLFRTSESKPAPWSADTWMLSEVRDRFGKKLYSFSYSRGKFIVQIRNADRTVPPSEVSSGSRSFPYSATLNSPVYLDSISEIDGTVVRFVHERAYPNDTASHVLYPSYYKYHPELFQQRVHGESMPFCYLQSELHWVKEYQAYQDRSRHDKISDPLASMDLEILKSVEISGGDIFDFSYDCSGRIHLSSVSVVGTGEYIFDYNSYSDVPTDCLTSQLDAWGYYNGGNGDSMPPAPILHPDSLGSFTPQHYGNASDSTSEHYETEDCDGLLTPRILDDDDEYRQPDENFFVDMSVNEGDVSFTHASKGMLTLMTYPTGGCTSLEYHSNTYYCRFSAEDILEYSGGLCGGLRVSKVENYESLAGYRAHSPVSSREYLYSGSAASNRTSGSLFVYPKVLCEWDWDSFGPVDRCVKRVGGSDKVQIEKHFAPCVGYGSVMERDMDGSYVKRWYVNARYLAEYVSPFSVYAYASLLGRVLREEYYDRRGVLSRSVRYVYDLSESFNALNFVRTNNGMLNPSETYYYYPAEGKERMDFRYYKMYHTVPKVTRKIEQEYISSDKEKYTVKITDLSYRNFKFQNPIPYKHQSSCWKCLSERVCVGDDCLSYAFEYPVMGNYYLSSDTVSLYCESSRFFVPQTGVKLSYGGKTLRRVVTDYDGLFEKSVTECKGYGTDTLFRFLDYTPDFQLGRYSDRNGVETVLVWDGMDRLRAVCSNVSMPVPSDWASFREKEGYIRKSHTGRVVSCLYDDLGHVVSVTGPNGAVMYYDYFRNRLSRVRDGEGKTVAKYRYWLRTRDGKFTYSFEDLHPIWDSFPRLDDVLTPASSDAP